MKKQVIFDDNQLIEIVNESAKRVLRGLVTESFGIDDIIPNEWKAYVRGDDDDDDTDEDAAVDNDYGMSQNWGSYLGIGNKYDIDQFIQNFGNGQNEAMLRQIGPENLEKLFTANKDAFAALSQDPMLLARIAGNPDVASKMAEDPSFMTKLATNPNVQSAFFANGPEQAMNFFSDQNMVNMMNNPNIDPTTRAQMYGMMNGQIAMDPMTLQNVMTQYAPSSGFLSNTWIGRALGWDNPQPQMMPQQAAMYMQQAGAASQEINNLQAQIAQMEKSDPNNPMLTGMKQNLEMMKGQMQMYAPAYKVTQNRYNTLMSKMQSGGMLTPQEMQEFQMSSRTLMDANMNGMSQYMTQPQQTASGQTSGQTSGNTQSQGASKGFLSGIFNGTQSLFKDVRAQAKQQANANANKRQQPKQAAMNRTQATPAATATPGVPTATAAATTPTTTAATATPTAQVTPTPQTPAQNQLQQTQQIQQTLANSPITQNHQVAGYNTNMTIQNPQGVNVPNQYVQRQQQTQPVQQPVQQPTQQQQTTQYYAQQQRPVQQQQYAQQQRPYA